MWLFFHKVAAFSGYGGVSPSEEDPQATQDSCCAQYLLHLPCAVSSGSQEDHTKSVKKTQRREEDIVSCVVIGQLLEDIQTKFNICCAEGIHFRQSPTWEWKGKTISDLPGGTDYSEHSVMTFHESKHLSPLLHEKLQPVVILSEELINAGMEEGPSQ